MNTVDYALITYASALTLALVGAVAYAVKRIRADLIRHAVEDREDFSAIRIIVATLATKADIQLLVETLKS